MRLILALAGLAALSACAGSPLNPQGTTHASGSICNQPFSLHDGKERRLITMSFICPGGGGGSMTIKDSDAFAGQQIAAESNRLAVEGAFGLAHKAVDAALTLIPGGALKLPTLPTETPGSDLPTLDPEAPEYWTGTAGSGAK